MSRFYELRVEAASFFPAHGWISNEGIKHIRMPIMRLYQHDAPGIATYHENGLAGLWLQSRSPIRTLRNIAVCLRELHKKVRRILEIQKEDWFYKEPSSERNKTLTEQNELNEQSEVLLVSAFTLLRRLGDEIIDASRPLLFKHWKSAPRELKRMISKVGTKDLSKLGPICDLAQLEDALTSHTTWFRNLRKENGIRDILIHKPHILSVGQQGTRDPGESATTWRMTAQLTQVNNIGILPPIDLFPLLINCLEGLCSFMTKFCLSCNLHGSYEQGDLLFLTGSDNDAVGFWPPIIDARTEFPLTE